MESRLGGVNFFFDNDEGRGGEGGREVGDACPGPCSRQPTIRGNKRIPATHVAVAASMCLSARSSPV